MGIMSNSFKIDYEGHVVEVESQGDFDGKTHYSLILDNERADQTEATLGHCTLRGQFKADGPEDSKPFVVRIKTGIFRDRCWLEVGEESMKIPRTR